MSEPVRFSVRRPSHWERWFPRKPSPKIETLPGKILRLVRENQNQTWISECALMKLLGFYAKPWYLRWWRRLEFQAALQWLTEVRQLICSTTVYWGNDEQVFEGWCDGETIERRFRWPNIEDRARIQRVIRRRSK